MLFDPVKVILLVYDEFLDHVSGNEIVVEQSQRFAHRGKRFCSVFAVVFQHFLHVGEYRIFLQFHLRRNAQLDQAGIDLLGLFPFLIGFCGDLFGQFAEAALSQKLSLDGMLLRIAEPTLGKFL